MRSTSKGSFTMVSPLRLNITTMVKSSAMSVRGLIRGMKTRWYQSRPLSLPSTKRVRKPAMKGTPR